MEGFGCRVARFTNEGPERIWEQRLFIIPCLLTLLDRSESLVNLPCHNILRFALQNDQKLSSKPLNTQQEPKLLNPARQHAQYATQH